MKEAIDRGERRVEVHKIAVYKGGRGRKEKQKKKRALEIGRKIRDDGGGKRVDTRE
jgi:hypothetical protein